MNKPSRILLAPLVFLSMTAWAQTSDPIVGVWNFTAFLNGSPLFIGVMTFHEGSTVTEFDTDGTNASAYESLDSGVWKNLGNGDYNFKAENFAYDSSGNLSQLQVPVCQLTLGPNENTFKGGCNITFYSCSLSQCPGTIQLNFSYPIVAKRF